MQENKERFLYYYSIVSPAHFMLSKIIFNTVLMIVMSLCSLALFRLFLGFPLSKGWAFMGVAILGGWSFCLIFTFLAAIAARAQQNAAIMAVLGFPLIMPQILILMKIVKACFQPLFVMHASDILLLVALDVLIALLSLILFPFLWRE